MSAGLALGLIASLAWGLVDITGALASRRLGSLRVLAGSQIVSLVALVGIVIVERSRLGEGAIDGVLVGLPLGVGAALAYLCYFTALRIGPLSVVSPVIVAYGGTTVILAVLLRGETLQPAQIVGAVLATAGVVLAAIVFDGGSMRGARLVGPGVAVAIVTMLLFATLTVALAAPIQDHGWLPVVLGSRLANTTSALVLLAVVGRLRSRRLEVLTEPSAPADRVSVGLVIVAGVFDIAAFAVYAVGLEIAPTWLVGLASSFGPVLAVAYAVWRSGRAPARDPVDRPGVPGGRRGGAGRRGLTFAARSAGQIGRCSRGGRSRALRHARPRAARAANAVFEPRCCQRFTGRPVVIAPLTNARWPDGWQERPSGEPLRPPGGHVSRTGGTAPVGRTSDAGWAACSADDRCMCHGERHPNRRFPSCAIRTSVLVFDVRWLPHPTSPRRSRRSRLAGARQLRDGAARCVAAATCASRSRARSRARRCRWTTRTTSTGPMRRRPGSCPLAPTGSPRPAPTSGADDDRVVPTGFAALDAILGTGGLPRSATVALRGDASSGKTTLALRVAAEAQATGAIVAWLDLARAFDPVEAVARGVRPEWLVVLTPVDLEEALALSAALLAARTVDLLVVDLPDGRDPAVSGVRVGDRLGRLAALARRAGTLLVVVEPNALGRGLAAAVEEASGLRLELERTGWIRLGRDVVGQRSAVTVARNRHGPPGRRADLEILYAEGGARDACLLRARAAGRPVAPPASRPRHRAAHPGPPHPRRPPST